MVYHFLPISHPPHSSLFMVFIICLLRRTFSSKSSFLLIFWFWIYKINLNEYWLWTMKNLKSKFLKIKLFMSYQSILMDSFAWLFAWFFVWFVAWHQGNSCTNEQYVFGELILQEILLKVVCFVPIVRWIGCLCNQKDQKRANWRKGKILPNNLRKRLRLLSILRRDPKFCW